MARLKEQPGKGFVVLGGRHLVWPLMRRDLVDAYVLLIHPLVLGSSRRLFPDGGPFAAMRLVDAVTTAPRRCDRDLPAGRTDGEGTLGQPRRAR